MIIIVNTILNLVTGRIENSDFSDTVSYDISSQGVQSNLSKETAQRTEKNVVSKTGGLLTQVNYSEKCAFGGPIGWSL